MIEETISTTLNSIVSSILPATFYSEAETDSYPFCVYNQTLVPRYTKDGMYKITSTCTIVVVSQTQSEASTLATSISTALESGMNNSTYTCKVNTMDPDCVDGIWTMEMNITINQYL